MLSMTVKSEESRPLLAQSQPLFRAATHGHDS
jgi:hypothetical protein